MFFKLWLSGSLLLAVFCGLWAEGHKSEVSRCQRSVKFVYFWSLIPSKGRKEVQKRSRSVQCSVFCFRIDLNLVFCQILGYEIHHTLMGGVIVGDHHRLLLLQCLEYNVQLTRQAHRLITPSHVTVDPLQNGVDVGARAGPQGKVAVPVGGEGHLDVLSALRDDGRGGRWSLGPGTRPGNGELQLGSCLSVRNCCRDLCRRASTGSRAGGCARGHPLCSSSQELTLQRTNKPAALLDQIKAVQCPAKSGVEMRL